MRKQVKISVQKIITEINENQCVTCCLKGKISEISIF